VDNKQKFISQIMTSKNPVRSCEDVDESVLSYAEIKALCIGDPRIKEKMDLDIQVSKLRMLEGSHKSQQYRLQDRVMKYYPKEIKQTQARMAGLEKDLERWTENSQLQNADEAFNMTVMGKAFSKDEKKEAGEAVIEAAKGIHGVRNANTVGQYKGFEMTLAYNFTTQKVIMNLRSPEGEGLTHQIELGSSPIGNISRIDNALEKIPERLESAKNYIEDLYRQIEAAKEELGRPFPQEQELKEKSARLAELDILLNMDSNNEAQPARQNEPTQSERQEEFEQEEERTPEAPEQENDANLPAPISDPQVGQRVVFCPFEGQAKLTGEVIDVSDTTITLRSGRVTIPVIRDKGTFSDAPVPDKTETLEYAQELALQHTGTEGVVFVAGGDCTYNGPIIEMTPTFLIQEVREGMAALHRLKDLGQENETKLQKGQNIVINKEAGKVMVSIDYEQNSFGKNASMER
jgi:hypothetical protein